MCRWLASQGTRQTCSASHILSWGRHTPDELWQVCHLLWSCWDCPDRCKSQGAHELLRESMENFASIIDTNPCPRQNTQQATSAQRRRDQRVKAIESYPCLPKSTNDNQPRYPALHKTIPLCARPITTCEASHATYPCSHNYSGTWINYKHQSISISGLCYHLLTKSWLIGYWSHIVSILNTFPHCLQYRPSAYMPLCSSWPMNKIVHTANKEYEALSGAWSTQ